MQIVKKRYPKRKIKSSIDLSQQNINTRKQKKKTTYDNNNDHIYIDLKWDED